MNMLEEFGNWCTEFVPNESLYYARLSPDELPQDFVRDLTKWIGNFIQKQHSIKGNKSKQEHLQLETYNQNDFDAIQT